MRSLHTSSSGVSVQKFRLEVVAQNLANAHVTGTEPGQDPYARKTISFKSDFDRKMGVHRVVVKKIGRDKAPFSEEYDPNHPAADENGIVKMPNVNRHADIRDMHEAMRAHHVNLTMIKVIKDMIEKTLSMISKP